MSSTKTVGTIKDVTFAWTSVTNPIKQPNPENKAPRSLDPLEMHSYEVKVLVSESVFKKLKTTYPGAKNFPYAKDLTAAECVEKKYMSELPDEDQVLVKFASACLNGANDKRKPSRPITQIGIKGRVQDMNGNEVIQTTSIGNGSKGHLQFNAVKSDFGTYLYPAAVCITDLVEGWVEDASEDFSDFGIVGLDTVDLAAPVVAEEFSDDIPF